MKNSVRLMAFCCLFLFSCDRKVLDQSSKVFISLPGSDANSLQNILDPLSVVTTYGNESNEIEEFDPTILPTFTALNPYPVNCFLVAIGSSTSESTFSKNYCGRRSATDGKIQQDYKFGPFAGLVPAGQNMEIEVPPGNDRVIYVFGVHALNQSACRSLASGTGENPSPQNFSKPHLVGKSATFSVTAGQTSVVPVNMTNPVAASFVDSCILSSLGSQDDRVANALILERNSFPFNTIVRGNNGDVNPTDSRCDYIDVVPKYTSGASTAGSYKAARVNSSKILRLFIDGSIAGSYSTKADCVAGTNQDLVFTLNPLDQRLRRWMRFNYSLGATATINVSTTDSTLSATKSFAVKDDRPTTPSISYSSTYYRGGYEISIPRKVEAGECYQGFFIRKSLEGFPISDSVTVTYFAVNIVPAGSAEFFEGTNCGVNQIVSGSSEIPLNNYYRMFSFRATQSFNLNIYHLTGFTTPIEQSENVRIEVSPYNSNPQPDYIEVNGKAAVVKEPVHNCHSVTFRFKNKDDIDVRTVAAGNMEVLFGQIQGDPTGIRFYASEECNDELTNVQPVMSISANSHYFKMYFKTEPPAQTIRRTVRFKVFDGIKYHFPKYEFDLVDKN